MGKIKIDPAEAVDKYRNKRFIFGRFDCLIFTNNVWNDVYGFKYLDYFLGQYRRTDSLKEGQEKLGYPKLQDAIDAKLKRFDGPVPPRGSLVMTYRDTGLVTSEIYGISLGQMAFFVGERDLQAVPIEDIKRSWVNNEEYTF